MQAEIIRKNIKKDRSTPLKKFKKCFLLKTKIKFICKKSFMNFFLIQVKFLIIPNILLVAKHYIVKS